jgi:hypothetical protein
MASSPRGRRRFDSRLPRREVATRGLPNRVELTAGLHGPVFPTIDADPPCTKYHQAPLACTDPAVNLPVIDLVRSDSDVGMIPLMD